MTRLPPQIGLVDGQPIAFGFRLEEMNCRFHADDAKARFQPKWQGRIPTGSPLVQPADGRTKGSLFFIQANGDTTLGGQ